MVLILFVGCGDLKDDFAKSFENSKLSSKAKKQKELNTSEEDKQSKTINELQSESSNGDGESQYKLAQRYLSGEDVVQSYRDAYKWFLISGKMGNGSANGEAQKISVELSPEQIDEINEIVKLWLEEYQKRKEKK